MINLLILLAGLVILIVSVVLGIVLPLGRAAPAPGRAGAPVPKAHVLRGIVGAFIGGLILVAGVSAPFVEVPAGNVGVVTNFGSVQAGTLEPGLHIVIPIVQHVAIIDTRVQPHQFQEIDAASSEYQTVKLTGVMNYHVDGQFASDLYQRVGTDFASKVIDPAFNDFIKTVVPAYKVDQILGARDEIRSKAKDALAANLSQYHIIVDDIYIANIAFSNEFQAAIEAKQVAQQQVQTEQQILAQKRIQAEQAVAQAQGQADSNVKLAEGQAAATIALANGQATANEALAASLSDQILQYQYIQKLADKISVMLIPSGNASIFDLKGLLGQATPTPTPTPTP
jgi:regulator of protease activity HflC (stomatin/prohibitin superfamily)